MKRKIILFVIVSFATAVVLGQTNTFPASGNVGIGTIDPSSILHIAPSIARGYPIALIENTNILGYGAGIQFRSDWQNNVSTSELIYDFYGTYYGGTNYSHGFNLKTGRVSCQNFFFRDASNNVITSIIDPAYGASVTYNSASAGFKLIHMGVIGIGTATPMSGAGLHLSLGDNSMAYFGANATWGGSLYIGSGTNRYSANTAQVISTNGNLHLDAGSSNDIYIAYYNPTSTFINPNGGNVGIGTISPTEKLSVNGNIRSKKLIVTQTGWSDYVFDSSYQLKPLTEVEQFIKTNKHLPDVPSAKEVVKEGIDVGDNQAVLLKKIEELTLYMIKQQKQVEKLEKEIGKLEK